MPEPKAQLVDPQGPIDVPGMQVTGVTTATGGFVGQVQGSATGFNTTSVNITVGVVTSTSFVGDVTGTASSVTKGANLSLGIVTASSFAGDVFGNAAGLSTTTAGLKLGIVTATSFAGNFTGIGSGITGTPNVVAGVVTATSFLGNFTGVASGLTGTPNLMVGILTGTAYSGDGSNLTGIAATNWITNNVTANSSTTAIDLALGNVVKFTQSANTTVSFANTGTSNIVTFVRPGANYTLTWPSSIRWDGGSSPTLNTDSRQKNVITLLTRDEGVSWYGWQTITSEGGNNLWTWGYNSYGALGHNNTTLQSSPIQVPGNWTGANMYRRVGDGDNDHAIYRKADGTLWGVGRNAANGQLGQNNLTEYSSPVQIPGTTWSTQGSITRKSVHGVKTDGTLWSWGYANWGILAQNNLTKYSSPAQIPGTTWRNVGGGHLCVFGTRTDNTLWAWGNNHWGKLGLNQNQGDSGAHKSSPVQIPGSWERASGLYNGGWGVKTDGTLWAWGINEYGTLANNTGQRSSPVQIPGTDWGGQTNLTMLQQGAICGLIKKSGELFMWGRNDAGQLGDNTTISRSSPIQIPGTTWRSITGTGSGDGSFIASKTDGTLWSWGNNTGGQYSGCLGQGDQVQYSSPTQIPGTWQPEIGPAGYGAAAIKS